jgi:putative ABC transport system permease protein
MSSDLEVRMIEWTDEIKKRLAGVRLPAGREIQIVEELAQHMDDRYNELRSKGASDGEAYEAALLELSDGGLLGRELKRIGRTAPNEPIVPGQERRQGMLAGLFQDLRYAARSFAARPGFAAAAIVTLALGIGANTAMFSVVRGVLLGSLPYEGSARLAVIFETEPELPSAPVTVADYLDWKNQSQAFESIAAGTEDTANLTGSGDPVRINIVPVSAGFFSTLGSKPALGREFLEEENTTGAKVVMISGWLWRSRFGSDPSLLGRGLTLNNETYEVVGVMPEDFTFPAIWNLKPDIWTPVNLGKEHISRGNHSLFVLGRLKPRTTFAQAQTKMELIAGRLAGEYKDTNAQIGARVIPLKEILVGGARQPLLILFAAVGFVLLIACANIANVLLTRSVAREREMAIRTALGASRSRLMRQLLTESLLLGLAGGFAGVFVARLATPGIIALSPAGYIPPSAEFKLSVELLLFALGVSLLTGTLFGLAPALRASRVNLNQGLKEGIRTVAGGARSARLRNLLVVTEVALALLLLSGAGLMVRSFDKLMAVDPGFDAKGVLTMRLDLPNSAYPTSEKVTAFFDGLVNKIDGLPGVETAGATSQLPLSGGPNGWIQIEGHPATSGFGAPLVQPTAATIDYFRAMRTPILEGRSFSSADSANSAEVVIINESLARTFWPGENPLGKHLSWGSGPKPDWREVIGVVRDTHEWGIARESIPEVFFPYAQDPDPSMTLVVRSGMDAAALAKAARGQIEAMDSDLPLYAVEPMTVILAKSIAVTRYQALLMGILGLLALVLASVGIYSVISYGVSQRTHEIGVRKSLGAATWDILKLTVGGSMKFVVAGLAIGLGGALALTRLMSDLLYGVTATDPLTFVVVSLVLAVVALVACCVPAWRATRIEPAVALRYE